MILLAFYLGVGALLHALFIGPHFDWSSAWTWGLLLGWPVGLMIGICAIALMVSTVTLPILAAMWLWEKSEPWRNKRMLRRAFRKGSARS